MTGHIPGVHRKGCPFEVRRFKPGEGPSLDAMYRSFHPKGKFQGMPPAEDKACRAWIKRLLEEGNNVLAWQGDGVIGHGVLLPDFTKKDAEYLIFVSRGSRGLGIGTALTRAALDEAGNLGLKTIWLTVDAYNFRAIRLYRKFAFQFSDAYRSASERMMVLELCPRQAGSTP